MLELTFLGSGSAACSDGRYWSSFLVDKRHLFDAPPTTLPHLKRLGVSTAGIETVFITHFHGDHFAGLPFLLFDYSYVTQRQTDLNIVGPPGCREFLESFSQACYPSLTDGDSGYRRVYTEATPGVERSLGSISFTAVEVPHSSRLLCFGYRIIIEGRTLAYTGDSEYGEAVLELGRGADVLVMDCTYRESGPLHMGLGDALELRRQLPASTALVLTHRESDFPVPQLENVFLAQDFLTLRL